MLHSENLTPHRSIWTLAVISAIVGVIAVSIAFGDGSAPKDTDIKGLPSGLLSSFGYSTHDKMAALPNTLLLMTLTSNFGTFMLYGLSCVICIVGFHKHPMYNPVKHMFIPLFGVLANVGCMVAYLVLPFMGYGTKMEPFGALGLAAIWAVYGGIFFLRSSKAAGRSTLVGDRQSGKATA
jgi:basic amino acid/polyamine antiporter, APA family